MTIWIEKVNVFLVGDCYEISTEYHDGICYKADTVEEAVKMYEDDKGVNVSKVIEMK